ncbi:hypothetical protein R4Z09_18080 [Niallia oryzisoli]|uniref:Uncharacterized protein n=1 Tax=Niallia oryzisoli TaxID=1737571 RepID=A0ABZ2C8I5_9BACI
MFILTGILCLVFLCASILILSSYPISQYEKNHPVQKKANKNVMDYYSRFFDVYEDQ